MLDEIYPHLRCARYLAIYYDSSDDHAVEIINGANAMIREGNHAQAYEALQGVREDMRAFNSIGVALMLQGRFEEAMPWFERAVSEMESAQADQNMAAIKREYEYETQQREEREAYLKKYE
jgi:tetratricopeptide (TPR) repeat protein